MKINYNSKREDLEEKDGDKTKNSNEKENS